VSELNSPVPERRNDELLTLVGKVALMTATTALPRFQAPFIVRKFYPGPYQNFFDCS
jgi:hypothetical protein